MSASRARVVSASTEARAALRNAGWVVAQRGLQVVVGALFALLVPRLMGPQVFGQYALVTSVSMWFALVSGLGAVSMMTRSVPAFVVSADHEGLRKLFSSLLALRTGTGLVAASLYLLLTTTWLRGFDLVALACIAGAVFSRTTANICFALFLGLNQAARWGLGEVLRRWLTLVFVLVGLSLGGLRGACAGILAAHTGVLLIALWMSRDHLRWAAFRPDLRFLAPFLRTGAYFAGGNLLLSLSQRTGETLVHLSTGDFTEVGYFGVAYALYLAGAQLLWHLGVALAPLLVGWKARGEHAGVSQWLERLSALTMAAAAAGLIGVLLVGDRAVVLVLGAPFAPAARNIVPLAVALLAVAVSSIGRLQALVADRPGIAAAAAGIELATFWTIGPLLAARSGSVGACLAVLAAASLNAAYLAWRLRAELPYSHRPAVRTALLALPVLPLAWFHVSWPIELALLAIALAAFTGLLFWARVVTVREIAELWRNLRAEPTTRTSASAQSAPGGPASPST